ncbi:SDR family NAD(P)-dependent oxidoreductase, partial [Dyella sp. S184]|uniref:SDR family NAD(P)-dependent oxidoreductase n=1 Tax=Dyella sp. S184 TaxID=1641862 RepID=UPI00131C73C2
VALADLAYTLQVGREAMEERLAVMAGSLDELREKLSAHVAGVTAVEGLYRGQVRRNKEALGTLLGDDDIDATVEAWIAKGKFGKLLDLWVKGLAFDWQRLYGENRPRRISLPTYPFARERYWIQVSATQPAALPDAGAMLHPLLHRNTSDMAGLRFSTRLSGEEFFLSDHVVQGVRVLPGVAQLEMARRAVSEVVGAQTPIELNEVVWLRPVAVGTNGLMLHIALYAEDDGDIHFEIYSDGEDGEAVVHGQGVAITGDATDMPTASSRHDLAVLREQCAQAHWDAAACYAVFEGMGLQYGPGFQGLNELFVGSQQVLARISLPAVVPVQDYVLHPSVLDAALQAALGLQMGSSAEAGVATLMLPYALGSLQSLAPCPTAMWAFVRHSAGSSAGTAVQRLDIDLCNESGVVCVQFRNFSMRSPSATGSAELARALDDKLLLAPVWDVVHPPRTERAPKMDANVLVVGGDMARHEAIRAQYPQAAILDLPHAAQMADIEQRLRAHGAIDHLIWILDASEAADDEALILAQQDGIVLGFRLVKALLALGFAQRPLGWSVLTCQTQAVHESDAVAPAHAGIHGFVGAMSKEFRQWRVRLLDMPSTAAWPWEQLFDLPYDVKGDALAWRSGQWFRQQLQTVHIRPTAEEASPYRQGGVYVVIGGAGGIGQAWSEHVIRTCQANVVWIGRRARDEAIKQAQTRMAAYGPMPMYIAADATDLASMQQARAQILARFPAIHGVVHAAIVLLDKSLAQMDEELLLAGLAAKIDVSVRMLQVFGSQPLDFMLFCSSLLSFIKAAGQSNYAAGCTFKDAYSLQLAKRLPYPVKVLNWGYWGSVGVVASPAYRERMAQQGIGSIEPEEGMRAIAQLLAAPVPQLGFLKVTGHAARGDIRELVGANRVEIFPARYRSLVGGLAEQSATMPFPVDAAQLVRQKRDIDRLALAILHSELNALGMMAGADGTFMLEDLAIRPGYRRWLAHSVQTLAQAGLLEPTGTGAWRHGSDPGSPEQAWTAWDQHKPAWLDDVNVRAQVVLVETMLRSLAAILQGRMPATSIMFPNSTMDLVEGIYRGSAIADHFNQVLSESVVAFVKARLQQDPSTRIRILEIGAGTGGTSARVLGSLAPYAGSIEQYCYTDLSRAFLLHAEQKYGPRHPYLTYQLFDVGSPLAGQEIEAGSYDLVIATNVLHATRDIRESLRNAKATLRGNGLCLLNELSGFEIWTHLTFGLLDGWWLYEDEALRIPGCPSLSPASWNRVLREEGYRHVFFPAQALHALGQQVVVAESDGVVPQRRNESSVAKAAHAEMARAVVAKPVAATLAGKATAQSASASLRDKCLLQFKKLVGRTLKMPVEKIDADTSLDHYGIDSILVLELINGLRAMFDEAGISIPVSTTLFFEYQTLAALADHFIQHETAAMMQWIGLEATAEPAHVERVPAPKAAEVVRSRARRGYATRSGASTPALVHAAHMDVAIVGLSGRYPQASDVTQFWANLAAGLNCITEVPAGRWDHSRYFDARRDRPGKTYSRWGGFLSDIDCFDPLFFSISPREAESMSPQERLFLQEAYASIEDAGYTPASLSTSRKVGVFVGVMNEHYATGGRFWSMANRTSYLFNFQGPSMAVDTACSSSLTAVHLALESLRSGSSEVAIAGGVNLIVAPEQLVNLSEMTMLSSGDKCKSFAADGDGFVDGEAVGAIVLKPLQRAIADGDQIYGVIKGSAVNAGGKTNGYMVPNPNLQAQLVRNALQDAGIDARNISYLEAQGTGSSLGDPIEILGLSKAFQSWTADKQFCSIGSAKSNVGHCESASGFVAISKVLMQMKHRMLVPSLHAAVLNPDIDFPNSPFVVQQELSPWARPQREIDGRMRELPRTAGISSFGAGGANAHLVIEEYVTPAMAGQVAAPAHAAALVLLSARNPERLQEQAQRLLSALGHARPELTLANLAYTLQVGREPMEERLALVADSLDALGRKLAVFVAGASDIDATYRGQAKRNKDAMALFAGDEDTGAIIETWMAKAKFDKLAELWVKGFVLDWNGLYAASGLARPSRISLPTYPFARDRYWIEHRREPNAAVPPPERPRRRVEPVEAATRVIVEPDTLLVEVKRMLAATVSTMLKVKEEDIDGDTQWSEFGFDSISLTAFANALNERYQVDLAPTIFFEFPNADGLAGYLVQERYEVLLPHFTLPVATVMVHEEPAGQEQAEEEQTEQERAGPVPAWPGQPAAAPNEPIAIIGMSGQFPQAPDIEAFWLNLRDGKDCISELPRERGDWRVWYGDRVPEENRTRVIWGGFLDGIDEFDPMFFGISPKEAELMDPQQRLMMVHVWKALEDAGYAGSALSGSNTAIYVGTMASGYSTLMSRVSTAIEGYSSTGAVASVGPNRMSYFLDFHGPSEPVETACSSSLVALRRATLAIQRGDCDMAIAGGVNTIVNPELHISFSRAGMLSEDGRCKTFSSEANGYVRGEGAAMLVLKRLSAAECDGDHIYGVVRGSAENHGGRANSLTAPNPKAQAAVVQQAYRQAGVDPRTVTYIEAHGTGTALGDPVEINGLKAAFRELYAATGERDVEAPHCGLGSAKTNIGHLELAAGIAGVIKVLLQMKHRTLVKSLHSESLNPYIELKNSPFYVVQESREWTPVRDAHGQFAPRRAGVSSFGFGGVNAHVVLEEYLPPVAPVAAPKGLVAVLVSARNEERLHEQVRQLLAFVSTPEADATLGLADLAYTLQVGREAMEERIGLVVGSLAELRDRLARFLAGDDDMDHVHRGQARRHKDTLAAFAADAELAHAVRNWAEQGELGKLLEVWVKGCDVDWTALHGRQRPRRISLPTYAFARERYWVPVGNPNPPATAGTTATLHPMVQRNSSNLAGPRFSSHFDGSEFFLADHVVRGDRVLPGVAQLEMARVAASEAMEDAGRLHLKDVAWMHPVVAGNDGLTLHVSLYPDDNGDIGYRVHGEGIAGEIVYGRGVVTDAIEDGVPATCDLATLRQQCTRTHLSAAQCYAAFDALGLHYGQGFQGLSELFVGEQLALARIVLPSSVQATKDRFALHPSLLDAAWQASIGLQARTGTHDLALMLPFALGSLEVLAPCTPSMWAIIRHSAGHASSDTVHTLDIDVCDEEGTLCLRFRQLSLKAWTSRPPGAPVRDVGTQEVAQREPRTDDAVSQPLALNEEVSVNHASHVSDDIQERALRYFVRFLSAALKLPAHRIDARAPMETYGIDSLLVLDLTRALEKIFGPLPKTLFFEYQTVAALSGYFMEHHRAAMSGLIGASRAVAAAVSTPLAIKVGKTDPASMSPRSRYEKRKPERADGDRDDAGEIAIIGLSGRYPQAGNLEEFW